MKKYVLIAISILIIGNIAIGQTSFEKIYSTSTPLYGQSIQQTSDGGYIIGGYKYPTVQNFPSGFYVIKTSYSGDTLWTKQYGITNFYGDYLANIIQTADGGYIMTGTPGEWDSISGNENILVIKTDYNGDVVWQESISRVTGRSIPSKIKQTSDGGYIIVGQGNMPGTRIIKLTSTGTISWVKEYDYGGPSYHVTYIQQTSDGGYVISGDDAANANPFPIYGAFLLKTDSMGVIIWRKSYTNSYNSSISCGIQTSDNGYIIASSSQYNSTIWNLNLYKTDSAGYLIWYKRYNNYPNSLRLNSIKQTIDGGYIITGGYNDTTNAEYKLFLLKTTGNGAVDWCKLYGGTKRNFANDVEQTADNGYIVGGTSNSFSADSTFNIYVIKTDANGNSGCNYSTLNLTPFPSYPTIGYYTPFPYSNYNFTTPSIIVSSGGSVTTLCTSVGTNEIIKVESEITISPNPFTSLTTITFNEEQKNTSLIITDVLGNIIQQSTVNGKQSTIDMSGFAKGIYFVRITDEKKNVVNRKMVKN